MIITDYGEREEDKGVDEKRGKEEEEEEDKCLHICQGVWAAKGALFCPHSLKCDTEDVSS